MPNMMHIFMRKNNKNERIRKRERDKEAER